MKTKVFLLSVVLFFWSCSNKDDTPNAFEDCPVPAIELPEILIELVDDKGNNLIANGTFSAEAILLEYPGYTASEFVVGTQGTDVENLIRVAIQGFGPQTVNVVLSDRISEPFSFNAIDLASEDALALNEFGCPIANLNLVIADALYNAIEQDIRDFNNDFGDFIVTIVR
ncbi:MAG: hypothetical protein AAGH81_01270 [Bacteroidota bacterium]